MDIRSLHLAKRSLRYAKWWAEDVDTILGRYSAAACGDRVAEAASEKLYRESVERQWGTMDAEERRLNTIIKNRSQSGSKELLLAEMSLAVHGMSPSSQLSKAEAALLALSRLLKLASPIAAEEVFIDEVLLSLRSEVDAALSTGETLVDVPSEHALAQFLALARAAVANEGLHGHMPEEAGLSKIQLVILPAHLDTFSQKLLELHSNDRPWKPCVAFHSTPHQDAWRGIARGNFDPEKCGRHDAGFYGRGTYFHTNVPYGGGGGSKTFFSLILKGVEYELNYNLGCPLEEGYDSHIAADRKLTGETVIFHQSQMIPVISYEFAPLYYCDDGDAYSDYSDYGCEYDLDVLSEYDLVGRHYWTAIYRTWPFDYRWEDNFFGSPCPDCSSCCCLGWCADSKAFDSHRTRCYNTQSSRAKKRDPFSGTPAPGSTGSPHVTALDMRLSRRSAPPWYWQRRSWRRAARNRTTARASERRSQYESVN